MGLTAIVCDKDTVLAASGEHRRDYFERPVSSALEDSMNMRTLENFGMVREVWVRGSSGRRKFYEAETDFWQIITNILSGREMRDVERALSVMRENINRLNEAMPTMAEEDRQLAELYIDRISKMQGLFRLAQVIITTLLTRAGDLNVDALTRTEVD